MILFLSVICILQMCVFAALLCQTIETTVQGSWRLETTFTLFEEIIYMMLVGIKHWLFSIKHWKLSLVVESLAEPNKPQLCLAAHAGKLLVVTQMLSVLLPLTFATILVEKMYWFHVSINTWVGFMLCSIFFLVDAYIRLTKYLERQQITMRSVARGAMVVQAMLSLVYFLTFAFVFNGQFTVASPLLKVALVCFIEFLTWAVNVTLMYQWLHIVNVAKDTQTTIMRREELSSYSIRSESVVQSSESDMNSGALPQFG